jgi:hypothetical protein
MWMQIAKLVTTPIFKMGVEAVTGFFMQNENPAAKAYAVKVAGEEAARVPETLAVAAKAYAVVQTGGAALGLSSIPEVLTAFNTTKNALFTPFRIHHNVKNVQFLQGVQADDGVPHQHKDKQGFCKI